MIKRRKFVSFLVFLFITVLTLSSVHAVRIMTLHDVDGTWSAGILDGSANGKFYDLSPGTAGLNTVSTIIDRPALVDGSVDYTVSLKKYNKWSFDTNLGTKNGRATDGGIISYRSWTVDESGDHYLYFDWR